MIKNVFFDLDGTLLPMDMDEFTNGYFGFLVKKAMPFGYEPNDLIKTIWSGVKAMVMNTGDISNEEAFWKFFQEKYGEESIKDRAIFDEFYANEFKDAKQFTRYNPDSKTSVDKIKAAGYRVVLATNPIFPEVATIIRTKWAGLDVSDFERYTTYENCRFCKPNPKYYEDLINELSLNPEECLMVGNDVEEDMEAGLNAGMKVFLITDCMINKNDRDISKYPNGTFKDLLEYLDIK